MKPRSKTYQAFTIQDMQQRRIWKSLQNENAGLLSTGRLQELYSVALASSNISSSGINSPRNTDIPACSRQPAMRVSNVQANTLRNNHQICVLRQPFLVMRPPPASSYDSPRRSATSFSTKTTIIRRWKNQQCNSTTRHPSRSW
jgi:hypothetical protein